MSNEFGDLVLSVSFNEDEEFVESFQIPYNITWNDFEALLKAQFDEERIAVSYLDTDNDEISIGSQDELFAAFRCAMTFRNTLAVKVLPLTPQSVVFRMEDESFEEDEPIVPNAMVAIPLPDVEHAASNRTDDSKADRNTTQPPATETAEPKPSEVPEPQQILRDTESPAPVQEPTVDTVDTALPQAESAPVTEQLNAEADPDTDRDQREREADILDFVYSKECQMWVPKLQPANTEQDKTEQPVEQQEAVTPDVADVLVSRQVSIDQDPGQLLQYSDFVTFMTQLKKELRCEIVRDVTRKTVKHVLKGLDGAVIESHQGAGAHKGSLRSGHTASSLPGDKSLKHEVYVHNSVFCDSCNSVIEGPRYKCGNCLDFDLCEACEAVPGKHNPNHVFLKIRIPCYRVGFTESGRKPLLRSMIYKTYGRRCGTKLVVPIPGEGESEDVLTHKLEGKMKDMFARNEEKRLQKNEKKIEKLKRKEEKLKRRIEMRNESPMKRERLELLNDDNNIRYDFYKVLMGAQFLFDITIPDATVLQLETKFVKTWRMKNDGDGPWSESTKLKLLWGNVPTPEVEICVPHLKPGEEGNISVDFISPSEAGEYQSHWKLYEHGMQFGSRIWCSIVVVPRETLEPTVGETDSLKVVVNTQQAGDTETTVDNTEQVEKEVPQESIEITIRSADEEHLREVSVKREEKPAPVQQEVKIETSPSATAAGKQEEEVAGNAGEEEAAIDLKDDVSETSEGFVVYAKRGDTDVIEEENKEKVEEKDQLGASIEDDLTSAVARLSLSGEKRDGVPALSYTTTPNNTPFDVTPLKSPNPEPEDDEELEAGPMLRPMSNSSSVELVNAPEEVEEELQQQQQTYVRQRMESLELKPDIDLESVSSYTDDDEDYDSSLSDSDYIIVPLPDCFDITKPLMQSTISSYSNSTRDLDDVSSHRSSRAVSVDDILTASSSIPTRPLSPTPSSTYREATPTNNVATPTTTEATPTATEDTPLYMADTDGSATSEATATNKGGDSNMNESFVMEQYDMPGGETADVSDKPDSVTILIDSQSVYCGVSSPSTTSPPEGSVDADVAVSSPVTMSSPEGATSESAASGAASAHSSGAPSSATTTDQREVTLEENTETKEPLSASAQMPDNVHYVKTSLGKQAKTVDFAPDFANQLVNTAVNAAGQAYITAKAVFKTWQDKDKQNGEVKQHGTKPKTSASGKTPAPKQWTPPKEGEFKPPQSQWKPEREEEPTPPQAEWKPPKNQYKPPKSSWKPAESGYKPPQSEWTPPKEAEVTPPKQQWTPPKEQGPMEILLEMGFFNADLNKQLLLKYGNDVERVIQDLLSRKNKDLLR